MLQNIMQINQGASFKSIIENFQNNNPNLMFNTKNIVKHIQYMKSKHQKNSKIDSTEIYQSIECQSKKLQEMHECEILIHEKNLNSENRVVKLDQISCTPPIVLNINNIVI
jgi:hypothetical protein